jgi:hypothetical protein
MIELKNERVDILQAASRGTILMYPDSFNTTYMPIRSQSHISHPILLDVSTETLVMQYAVLPTTSHPHTLLLLCD